MKNYIVKFKDSKKIFGEFASKEEASDKVMEFINDHYISPFDFELEEVEYKDVNEVITDFETARRALGSKSNSDFGVVRINKSENGVQLKDVTRLVSEITPKHLEALIALNKLFTIAEAWNKADGFVPDFSDDTQCKYFPWFAYNNYTGCFVSESASYTLKTADACIGSRLCFKTRERAEQFGKQFADLYNEVLLSK